jgi:tetratricopeptide (TPR) repeat protein
VPVTVSLAALLAASCKTSFRISVKEPAVINIPQETLQFGVINSVTKANSPEQVIGTVLSGGSVNGNVEVAARAVEGIFRGLNNSGYLSGKSIQTDSLRDAAGAINWDYLDTLGKQQGLQGFIEIAEIRTTEPIGGTVGANLEGQNSSRLDGTAYVNYYILKDHIIHERFVIQRSYRIPTSGTTNILDVLGDMQRKREYYRALGFELGLRAGNLVYPNIVWVDRKYYTKGSRELKQAKPMIKQGNWDIAEKQLEYGLTSGNRKVQGRTYFNLALVKEGQGELGEAIKYAETAALEFGNKLANEYLVTLRDRKWQMEQVENQQAD